MRARPTRDSSTTSSDTCARASVSCICAALKRS
nr:MAG TPA: hypothetical protein [Caudoviricetes sp.]